MSYSINPKIPKARALAFKLLINEGLTLKTVANNGNKRLTVR